MSVGIVVVSHSARLAEGVVELARGMAGPDVRLAATGGLAVPDQPLGTDAMLVLEAIERVYSDDGVLVLMDLGSAVLSAEMALDMLEPEPRSRVRLCAAPLVEGAVFAAVQARLGSSLEQVAAEAVNALAAKTAHLGHAPAAAPTTELSATPGPRHTLRITVRNRLGLHARPAARLVQTAGRFASDIRLANVTSGRGPVNARSINAVATLGVKQNDEVEITATGPDAQAALEAIRALADDHFGDAGTDAAPSAEPAAAKVSTTPGTLQGIPASPGIAIGPARSFRTAAADIPSTTAADPDAEWNAFNAAIDKTRAQITAARDAVARQADRHAADIFDAHLLFLEDELLLAPTRRAIFEDRLNAAAAWHRTVQTVAARYRALDDDYLRSRAADVLEVGQQALAHLLGQSAIRPALDEPGILLAAELTSADAAHLDPARVLGICTAFGGPTSHSTILARALGIPAVVGIGSALRDVADGMTLIVDGASGQVRLNPDEATIHDYARRAEIEHKSQAQALAISSAPAITRDGRRIEIAANISSVAEAAAAVRAGADAVGVFRTEFLFLDRQTAPGEDEQYSAYRAAAQALGGRPLIIRTLDVGGDKPLPYVDQGQEANPFLGWRAIRLCLARPEFFRTQLRAIVRTAAEFPVSVMFPMIATLDEFRAAKALLADCCAEVSARGEPAPQNVVTGMMVEIPAAALQAYRFAGDVDFFSIGTNDLTQYTMAAERGNPRVEALNDSLQPAVLKLIGQVVNAAHDAGKWAGVCGEMASDPLAIPLLVGLGVDELSMNAGAIPRAKQIVRALDHAALVDPAQAALSMESAEAVRAAARLLLPGEGD